jgi:hypothetical protein
VTETKISARLCPKDNQQAPLFSSVEIERGFMGENLCFSEGCSGLVLVAFWRRQAAALFPGQRWSFGGVNFSSRGAYPVG